MFIVSLAIADLIVGLIVMPISAIYIFTEEWLFGVAVCQFWIGIDYTASTASILNLFILSLDRYWSVTTPLQYIRRRTKRRALLMISIVWFLSLLWLVPILGWHHFEHNGIRTVPPSVCDTEYATNTALKIVTGTLNYYLPLAIMYAIYGKIFMEIRKRSKLEVGLRMCGGIPKAAAVQPNSFSDESDEPRAPPPPPCARRNCVSALPPLLSRRLSDNLRAITAVRDGEHEYTKLESKCDDVKSAPIAEADQTTFSSSPNSPDAASSDSAQCTTADEAAATNNAADDESHALPTMTAPAPSGGGSGATSRVAETSLSSPYSSPFTAHSDRAHVLASSPRRQLPKEVHPVKTQSVRRPRPVANNRPAAVRVVPKPTGAMAAAAAAARRKNGTTATAAESALLKRAIKWRVRAEKWQHRPSTALQREIKAARQLGVIMGAFTLCFFPYFVCFMVVAFCDGCIGQSLMSAMTWIGYINSTMNPFLYPLCNLNFRRKFRMMLRLEVAPTAQQNHSMRYSAPRPSPSGKTDH
ncbi:hypothetical protein NP493_489g01001 [Ridgeia piscesae]|uniref:G-protein coupled receptors family 1 profile domain-containing protein n=1 Tax=Ridgeia piscesae TaxID=27915 RepID=A0AAD9KXX0_RIDPI|nr:hypothetical protein NP493_489g01001 [Ridgeia piscesae]